VLKIWNQKNLAEFIIQTLFKTTGTKSEIKKTCAEARKFGFTPVCIQPVFVDYPVQEWQQDRIGREPALAQLL